MSSLFLNGRLQLYGSQSGREVFKQCCSGCMFRTMLTLQTSGVERWRQVTSLCVGRNTHWDSTRGARWTLTAASVNLTEAAEFRSSQHLNCRFWFFFLFVINVKSRTGFEVSKCVQYFTHQAPLEKRWSKVALEWFLCTCVYCIKIYVFLYLCCHYAN